MKQSFDNDVFVSYPRERRNVVKGMITELRAAGLNAWWDKDIEPGANWDEKLKEQIKNSRHFVLYCNAEAKASKNVKKEVGIYREDAATDLTRKLFVLRAPDCKDSHIPKGLGKVQHVNDLKDVIVNVLKEARAGLEHDIVALNTKVHKDKKEHKATLAKEQRRVAEAQEYYRHRRFWRPFAENNDVHIFTCGRDIPPDEARPRGTGGFRTNIDKWDYRAVLGIAHYFALNYPSTRLTIEDPASKLQQEDIQKTNVLANRIAEIGSLLKEKDCIIIGSPDVNDFAEIVLSRIHGIDPYGDDRKKSKGFVLVRNRKNTASTFYWKTQDGEDEGIARLQPGEIKIHGHHPASVDAGSAGIGEMHGILVVADNPFSELEPRRRIMMLSGFSGVATNGMAKFLTEETYLPSFFEFDEAQSQETRPIEALISVKYFVESGSENKDARQIHDAPGSITFKELLAI